MIFKMGEPRQYGLGYMLQFIVTLTLLVFGSYFVMGLEGVIHTNILISESIQNRLAFIFFITLFLILNIHPQIIYFYGVPYMRA